mmetsp:Transcript_95991/g.296019  ORF Transcript_95991/g.296019 Transcript_95991/m.296019 type:complete len:556 (+) Transcript_95991:271-1938(+)
MGRLHGGLRTEAVPPGHVPLRLLRQAPARGPMHRRETRQRHGLRLRRRGLPRPARGHLPARRAGEGREQDQLRGGWLLPGDSAPLGGAEGWQRLHGHDLLRVGVGRVVPRRPALLQGRGGARRPREVRRVLLRQGHGPLRDRELLRLPVRRLRAEPAGLALPSPTRRPPLQARERARGEAAVALPGGARALPAQGLPLRRPLRERGAEVPLGEHPGGRPRVRRQPHDRAPHRRARRGGRAAPGGDAARRADPRGEGRRHGGAVLRPALLAGELRPRPRSMAAPGGDGAARAAFHLGGVRPDRVRLRARPGRRAEVRLQGGGARVGGPDVHQPRGEDPAPGRRRHHGRRLRHRLLLAQRHGPRDVLHKPRLVQQHPRAGERHPRDRPRHRHEPRAEEAGRHEELPRPRPHAADALGEHRQQVEAPVPHGPQLLHGLRGRWPWRPPGGLGRVRLREHHALPGRGCLRHRPRQQQAPRGQPAGARRGRRPADTRHVPVQERAHAGAHARPAGGARGLQLRVDIQALLRDVAGRCGRRPRLDLAIWLHALKRHRPRFGG